MIREIRRRFIRIALLVLALAMLLVALVINVSNWISVRGELSETLSNLAQSGGRYDNTDRRMRGGRSRDLQNRLNEARFFSATMTRDGILMLNDTSRETEYTDQELRSIVLGALNSGRADGFAGEYLYSFSEEWDGNIHAVFLNCATRLSAVRSLAVISLAACAGGILLAWALVALFSSRAIRPMIENAAQQKRFITDAGHELKTPLTVISANMDVLALEAGENDWIKSTQKQVSNMRGLVNELIYLSRLDEEDSRLQNSTFDLGETLREVAEPFVGMADFSGKSMNISTESELKMYGDRGAIQRLISVLCDNAVKYAPEGDTIALTLKSDGRRAILTVENGLCTPMNDETLKHLFDRFYRVDASRSRDSGGYGIGLSVAKAVAEKHGGRIRARITDNGRLRFIVSLPAGAHMKRR